MMSDEKQILIYLANGVQGGAVVRQALKRGYSVRALVRDPEKSEGLWDIGARLCAGDLEDPASLDAAHQGIDTVVLQMPPGAPPRIAALMDNAIAAIRAGGARGVIVKMASANPTTRPDEPGFAANRIIEDKMRDAGLPFSIIRPTMYLDNLLRPEMRAAILGKGALVLPIPVAQQIAWTSVDDSARAALTLLDNDAFGHDCLISGPESVDGEGLAHAFSQALSRDVEFQSLPLDALERQVDSAMGAGVGKRVSAKLRFFEAHPDEADRMLSPPFQSCRALGGFVPTAIQVWASDHRSSFA
jgi:uncharacterized protein YbjT (DUF2867 family)